MMSKSLSIHHCLCGCANVLESLINHKKKKKIPPKKITKEPLPYPAKKKIKNIRKYIFLQHLGGKWASSSPDVAA